MVLLLAIIYVTFISLGLPDSLFGTAWPVMHRDLAINESFASVYIVITALCSGGISFVAGPLIRKFGTGKVTAVSVLLTAIGMLVIGFSNNIWIAMVGSVIMGLGAGAIDTGLNNFVSLHYKASHMNWLHCFWGIGVTVSPLIMSIFLAQSGNWRGGYKTIAYIQFGITALVFLSLPLWKKYDKKIKTDDISQTFDESQISNEEIKDDNLYVKDLVYSEHVKIKKEPYIKRIFKIKGLIFAVLSLGFYCSMEFLVGTWGASYIVNIKNASPAIAAKWVSLYFGGIIAGRLLSGFLSYKMNDKQLIRIGEVIALTGLIVLALPINNYSLLGLLLIGTGFGPIFPSTIHSTPFRFGEKYSADITGIQMGGAYAIGWMIQFSFGFIAPATTFAFMPYLMIGLCLLVIATTETVNKLTAGKPLKEEEI